MLVRRRENELRKRGIGFLVYAILDAIVDDYFPVVGVLADRIEELEERTFETTEPRAQREIFVFRKDLTAIRRILGPERDVMNVLVRRDSPALGNEIAYIQDVYDHTLRATDSVDTYRDLLGSALDAYLSVTSNRLNRVMKTLAASSLILMSMTLVAGVYGRNFARMPEKDWTFGYAWALGLMAAIGVGLAALLRRIDCYDTSWAGKSGRAWEKAIERAQRTTGILLPARPRTSVEPISTLFRIATQGR